MTKYVRRQIQDHKIYNVELIILKLGNSNIKTILYSFILVLQIIIMSKRIYRKDK